MADHAGLAREQVAGASWAGARGSDPEAGEVSGHRLAAVMLLAETLEARILAVADAYEAMVADRPYRPGLPPEQARAELERCARSQFDPAVIAAFLRILDRRAAPLVPAP